jgi:hypothetical protein
MQGAKELAGSAADCFLEAVAVGAGGRLLRHDFVVFGVEIGSHDEAQGLDGVVLVDRLGEPGAAEGEAFHAVERGLGARVFEERDEFIEGEAVGVGEVREGLAGLAECHQDGVPLELSETVVERPRWFGGREVLLFVAGQAQDRGRVSCGGHAASTKDAGHRVCARRRLGVCGNFTFRLRKWGLNEHVRSTWSSIDAGRTLRTQVVARGSNTIGGMVPTAGIAR